MSWPFVTVKASLFSRNKTVTRPPAPAAFRPQRSLTTTNGMEYAPMTPVRNAEDLKAQHEEQLKKLASVLKDRIAPSR